MWDTAPRAAAVTAPQGNERGCRHPSHPSTVPRAERRRAPKAPPTAVTDAARGAPAAPHRPKPSRDRRPALPPRGSTAESQRRPKATFVAPPCGTWPWEGRSAPRRRAGPPAHGRSPRPGRGPPAAISHRVPTATGDRGGAAAAGPFCFRGGALRCTWAAAGKGRPPLCVGSWARLRSCRP